MFHREGAGGWIRGIWILFFSEPDELRKGYIRHASGADLVVTEGVMGYYDGRGLDTDAGSSYDVARTLDLRSYWWSTAGSGSFSGRPLCGAWQSFRSDSNYSAGYF